MVETFLTYDQAAVARAARLRNRHLLRPGAGSARHRNIMGSSSRRFYALMNPFMEAMISVVQITALQDRSPRLHRARRRPPLSLIRQADNIEEGLERSPTASNVGKISKDQLREIATKKSKFSQPLRERRRPQARQNYRGHRRPRPWAASRWSSNGEAMGRKSHPEGALPRSTASACTPAPRR